MRRMSYLVFMIFILSSKVFGADGKYEEAYKAIKGSKSVRDIEKYFELIKSHDSILPYQKEFIDALSKKDKLSKLEKEKLLGIVYGILEIETGKRLPWWTSIFFILMLLSVALFPLILGEWWEHNKNKLIVSAIFGIPMVIYLVFYLNFSSAVLHTLEEYFAFIVLLAALYIISGGIHLKGTIKPTPLVNTTFIGIGSILANLIGTTGASMILIKPILKVNSERKYVVHTVVFFIFLVSNIGGSLLPIGDPPLFLGFLKGVPFFWTLKLWPIWLTTVVIVLAVYYLWDRYLYTKKEDIKRISIDVSSKESLKLEGGWNFFLLLGVILSIIFINPEYWPSAPKFMREIVMIALAIISLAFTKKRIREANDFSFYPINEVAAVFIGIFMSMIPVLMILKAEGTRLHLTEPWQYFWLTGSLSAFLDNAPTYLTFFSLAQGVTLHLGNVETVANVAEHLLVGISTGAVFMGAMTYIGNAPNFMVRSIADDSGIKMPSFFGYMKYSLLILIPIFIIINIIFLGL